MNVAPEAAGECADGSDDAMNYEVRIAGALDFPASAGAEPAVLRLGGNTAAPWLS